MIDYIDLLEMIIDGWDLGEVKFTRLDNSVSCYNYSVSSENLSRFLILIHSINHKPYLNFYFDLIDHYGKIQKTILSSDFHTSSDSFQDYNNCDDGYYLNYYLIWNDFLSWDLNNPKCINDFQKILKILGFNRNEAC